MLDDDGEDDDDEWKLAIRGGGGAAPATSLRAKYAPRLVPAQPNAHTPTSSAYTPPTTTSCVKFVHAESA